jgi:FkbH-like protein
MKILCISDITLDNLIRSVEKKFPSWNCTFIFAENLILQFQNINLEDDVDVIYIHVDSYFKKYASTYLNLLVSNIFDFASKTKKTVVCSNLIFESFKSTTLDSSLGFFFDSSGALIDLHKVNFNKLKNLYFIDVWGLLLDLGINNVYNFRLGHLYQMPYSKNFMTKLEDKWVKYIQKLIEPDKKVIILDCDNTLWKGIIGEDGIDGIKCDLNEEGILYYHFHQFLIQKKSEGFLLAICSKNNEEDVKEAFEKKNMPLKWSDFILKKINWLDKAVNIQEIAKELNLGIDSFIFIDDSDFETNSIKSILPEVYTIKIGNEYSELIQIFNDLKLTKKNTTSEDLNKTEQYLVEVLRNEIKENTSSFDEYVKSLEVKINLAINSTKEFERISQLTEKTNQFNFNKRKYDVSELLEFVQRGEMKIFSIRVNDKFGDYGLVGVIIVTFDGKVPVLENFIMSCRALGRRIEYDFLKIVKKILIEETGLMFNFIKFKKTEKNAPAEIFYNEIIKNYGI